MFAHYLRVYVGNLLLLGKASNLRSSRQVRGRNGQTEPMNCNVCDQLAAEMGELLLKQKILSDAAQREGSPSTPGEDLESVTTQLRAARQRLIDHLRLIHGSGN